MKYLYLFESFELVDYNLWYLSSLLFCIHWFLFYFMETTKYNKTVLALKLLRLRSRW
jgi:hypothetical protein